MSTQGPSSTSTTSVPDWLSGAAQGFLNAGSQAAQMPYQPYNGPRVADLSPLQNQALAGYGQVGQAMSPYYQAAGGALNDIIGGNQNPYQQNVINATTRQVTDAYNNAVGQTSGRFNSAGNFDSARHDMADERNQRALATGLSDGLGSVNANAFTTLQNQRLQGIGSLNSSLGSMTGALSNAIQAGDIPRQQLQQVYNTGYNDFTEQRNYPWTQLQNAAGLFGSLNGAVPRTTTQQQGYDPVSQGVGALALGNAVANNSSKGGSSGAKGGSGVNTGLSAGA